MLVAKTENCKDEFSENSFAFRPVYLALLFYVMCKDWNLFSEISEEIEKNASHNGDDGFIEQLIIPIHGMTIKIACVEYFQLSVDLMQWDHSIQTYHSHFFLKKASKHKRNASKSHLNVLQVPDIIWWHIQKSFVFSMNWSLLSLVKYWWELFRISSVNHMSLMIYGLSGCTADKDNAYWSF